MAEYISREAAIKAIRNDVMGGLNAEFIVNKLPAADVRPVVRGRWVREDGLFRCSICDEPYLDAYGFNFCPNCGADMRAEEGE